jgi:hypothetical protein
MLSADILVRCEGGSVIAAMERMIRLSVARWTLVGDRLEIWDWERLKNECDVMTIRTIQSI